MSFSLIASIITESYLRCLERQNLDFRLQEMHQCNRADTFPQGMWFTFHIPLIIPSFLEVNNTPRVVCMPLMGQTAYITIFKSDPSTERACRGRSSVEVSGLSCSCLCVVGVPKVTNSHRQWWEKKKYLLLKYLGCAAVCCKDYI